MSYLCVDRSIPVQNTERRSTLINSLLPSPFYESRIIVCVSSIEMLDMLNYIKTTLFLENLRKFTRHARGPSRSSSPTPFSCSAKRPSNARRRSASARVFPSPLRVFPSIPVNTRRRRSRTNAFSYERLCFNRYQPQNTPSEMYSTYLCLKQDVIGEK